MLSNSSGTLVFLVPATDVASSSLPIITKSINHRVNSIPKVILYNFSFQIV